MRNGIRVYGYIQVVEPPGFSLLVSLQLPSINMLRSLTAHASLRAHALHPESGRRSTGGGALLACCLPVLQRRPEWAAQVGGTRRYSKYSIVI